MIRQPPRSTRTDTLLPYTTLFRSPVSKNTKTILPCIAKLVLVTGVLSAIFRKVNSGTDAGAFVASLLLLLLRSEEHTSELQSLMRISYAVFCLNKQNH